MPELPEVESIARTLRDGDPPLAGSSIRSVDVFWDGVFSGAAAVDTPSRLEGCRFGDISRQGKHLVFQLVRSGGQEQVMVIHLRMTGRLTMVPGDLPPGRHTRLSLNLDNGYALRFDDPRKFGRVWLTERLSEVSPGMGPDALTVTLEVFAGRLTGHSRQVKPLLLDQSFVAGIGNIYADESLFRAGLHPLRNSSGLLPAEVSRLHAAVISVLEEAVAAGGANIDGVFKAGAFIVGVYGRDGSPCRTCGTGIRKIRVGQRGTHFCPRCQVL